jgi:hypothetical protein
MMRIGLLGKAVACANDAEAASKAAPDSAAAVKVRAMDDIAEVSSKGA